MCCCLFYLYMPQNDTLLFFACNTITLFNNISTNFSDEVDALKIDDMPIKDTANR